MNASAIDAEVVVIGGGAAGAAAALAARRLGRSVALVRRAWGATAVSSGAADVAPDPLARPGAPRGEGKSILECARLLGELRPDHPYAALRGRLPLLDEALGFAREATGLLEFAPAGEENRWLLSPLGTPKLTAGGLGSVLAGDLRGVGRVGVVGFARHPRWDPEPLARALPGTAVALDYLSDERLIAARPHELAAAIDGDRERFLASLRRALSGPAELLLLPPVLFDLDWIEAALAVRCAELPALLPSLPGLRLQRRLEERLEEAGVRLVRGEAFSDDGGVAGLRVRDADPAIPDAALFDAGAKPAPREPQASWPVRARAAVLATGKFVGGGVRREARLREPVFDLPIVVAGAIDEGRWLGDLTSPDLGAPQEAFRAGVAIDDRLRPLGADGAPRDGRLFACGAVLGGNDAARDGAGVGLAWFTGWLAGREAAARAAEEG